MLMHPAPEVVHSFLLRPLVQLFHVYQFGGILAVVKRDRLPLFDDNVCSNQGPVVFADTVEGRGRTARWWDGPHGVVWEGRGAHPQGREGIVHHPSSIADQLVA